MVGKDKRAFFVPDTIVIQKASTFKGDDSTVVTWLNRNGDRKARFYKDMVSALHSVINDLAKKQYNDV